MEEHYWIADSGCKDPGDPERLLIDRRDDLELIAEIDDPNADYSYDSAAVVKLGTDYYVVGTSGCSCPSPSETWGVYLGPVAKDEAVKYFAEGEYAGCTYPQDVLGPFIDAIKAS